MDLLSGFLTRSEFQSYEDYYENYEVKSQDSFNFAFDVVDIIAAQAPDKVAMVWCDDKGREEIFTFGQVRDRSNKAANFFTEMGIQKGDAVMLVLKRHYEFWFCLLGLHRIGAIAIPATHLLTKKDIVYRSNAADVKMIVAVADEEVMDHVDSAIEGSPSLAHRVVVEGSRDGWID